MQRVQYCFVAVGISGDHHKPSTVLSGVHKLMKMTPPGRSTRRISRRTDFAIAWSLAGSKWWKTWQAYATSNEASGKGNARASPCRTVTFPLSSSPGSSLARHNDSIARLRSRPVAVPTSCKTQGVYQWQRQVYRWVAVGLVSLASQHVDSSRCRTPTPAHRFPPAAPGPMQPPRATPTAPVCAAPHRSRRPSPCSPRTRRQRPGCWSGSASCRKRAALPLERRRTPSPHCVQLQCVLPTVLLCTAELGRRSSGGLPPAR